MSGVWGIVGVCVGSLGGGVGREGRAGKGWAGIWGEGLKVSGDEFTLLEEVSKMDGAHDAMGEKRDKVGPSRNPRPGLVLASLCRESLLPPDVGFVSPLAFCSASPLVLASFGRGCLRSIVGVCKSFHSGVESRCDSTCSVLFILRLVREIPMVPISGNLMLSVIAG